MEHSPDSMELHAIRAYPHHRQFAIYGDAYDERGHRHISVHSPICEEVSEFAATKPLVTIGEEAAQKLFQSLWDAGLRPESQDGNTGMLAATQDHLADMRKLVASCLAVEL